MTVTIINYGLGNLGSIQNMLRAIDVDSVICDTAQGLRDASVLILPGVGHFDHGMRHLAESGMMDVLNEQVMTKKIPILGICLGAQLLMQGSAEGQEKGLGWIEGDVKRFVGRSDKNDRPLKVPHMGWCNVIPQNGTKLFDAMDDDRRFYFVHSYHLCPDNKGDVLATSDYGGTFVSAVRKGNITGAQFHPEKSHQYGMQFLRNYFSEIEAS